MKFAIASEHVTYFEKHRQVELEGFFSDSQLLSMKECLEGYLERALHIPRAKIATSNGELLFKAGHDLWRHEPKLQKLVLNPSLAEIAAELTDKKQIRLGYDQLLPTYAKLVEGNRPFSLQELCYFQGSLCGLMIALTDNLWIPTDSLLPKKAGNIVFFDSNQAIPFDVLRQEASFGLFWMFVYVSGTALYIKQTNDPHVHAPRELGYTFGDRLRDDRHPIVYRSK